MRLLHTSDWHLGHTLHGVDRADEHARFLGWLEETVERERVDALLVTGDVFDSATPPASAERALLDLLARLRAAHPRLGIIITGGNHDSPARLESWAGVLRALSIHVVATLRGPAGFEPGRAVVPLRGRDGQVEVVVAAVPFLRPVDLPPRSRGEGGEVDPTRSAFDAVVAAARARLEPGQALVVTGHLAVRGALLSPDSERRVAGEAPGAELFPPDAAYVALGHLHRAQAVGARGRYAGSPLPLSMAEADYEHQVVLVDVDGAGAASVRTLRIPRTVEVRRVPERGPPLAVEEALARLAELPDGPPPGPGEVDRRPLLEVKVALAGPEPGLRRRVEVALEGKAVRLVRLVADRAPGETSALADAAPHARLDELAPRDVLSGLWKRERDAEVPPEVLAAFDALVLEVVGGVCEPVAADGTRDDRGEVETAPSVGASATSVSGTSTADGGGEANEAETDAGTSTARRRAWVEEHESGPRADESAVQSRLWDTTPGASADEDARPGRPKRTRRLRKPAANPGPEPRAPGDAEAG